MSYVKPQVLVFQEFSIVPTEITEPLRAHISGPHAVLHRYNNAAEKPLCRLGAYDKTADTVYAFPGRLPGSIIDRPYTKVLVEDALLEYYSDSMVDTLTTIRGVADRRNWIEAVAGTGANASGVNFRTNGAYSRSANKFYDRDVKIGDIVYLRSVTGAECTETELWTTVAGFASQTVSAVTSPAAADSENRATGTASTSSSQIAGTVNNVDITAINATNYNGVYSGAVNETYTVEVITSGVVGCAGARLRVKSASKLDDVLEINPGNLGDEVAIGTRGLKVTFAVTGSSSSSSGSPGSTTNSAFVVGQKWQIVVNQAFTAGVATSSGTYTGDKNDTYIIECVKGGYFSDATKSFPQVTVRTAKGLDYSTPFEVTSSGSQAGNRFPVGSYGVAVSFAKADGTALPTMRRGDKWYVNVTSSATGAVNRLILKNDLPAAMAEATALDLKLFIKKDIELSLPRIGFAPAVNYSVSGNNLTVKAGAIAYDPTWTSAGAEQPLPVASGTLYVQFREWLSELCDEVNAISSVSDLGQIRGQLDPDNPLKWGVYKALSNSNGTAVKYTAVCAPDDMDSWQSVLARLGGRDDLYNLVPLTFNVEVQNLYAAYINNESNEIANNWKAGFFGLSSRSRRLVIGQGAAIAGVSGTTISSPVLATVSANLAGVGAPLTLLRASGAGYFITNGVQPGDLVRYNYAVDGFGNELYTEYTVDSVLSENSLLLYSAVPVAVTVAQRVEIWHNMDRNEMAEDIGQQAAALASRRVCAVWPDQVGSAGVMQPGYFLAAALAGLASGVVPHQGLTNVEVAGFDDYSRSYKMFNETQLNRLAEAGVWIVTEDREGTPFTRHALTTDMLDLNRREEMIRRNVDSISYLFLRRLRPYIGRTNASPAMVDYLRNRIDGIISFLATGGNTAELGTQLIDGSIAVLRIHPLLKDRIEIVLNLTVPAPLNNIELHLVV
jgi:hypothetical protein